MASDAPAPNMVSRLAPRLVALAVPITAVVAALALGAIMLIALGASPLSGYAALLDGAFGGWNALADTALKGMPLLLVGVGICIAFRTGVVNLGGEG
ncbi:MAG: ABC transporter permease, partial [Actinomycetota bacterium]|nr:ABC transporter permease [Actinomycetota bacterium]